jgi:hypothetical protein
MRFDIHTQQSNLPFDIKADETLEDFQKRALQDINKIIKNEKSSIQLDFGNFGQILLRREPECSQSKNSILFVV